MNNTISTLLITGANRGIGLEFVTQYAADNWRIIACCRQPDHAESLRTLKNIHGDRLLVHELDLSDFMAIDRLADTCLLYTSDAADERSSVDLGGRRIIKKKTKRCTIGRSQSK